MKKNITRVKMGCILLSIWSGLNLLVGMGVTVMLVLGHNAPALSYNFTDTELATLDPQAVAVVNGLAILANPLIAALCGLTLFVLWKGVFHGMRWAWWSIAIPLVFVQIFGFLSDRFFADANIVANVGSTVLLVTALLLAYPHVAPNKNQ